MPVGIWACEPAGAEALKMTRAADVPVGVEEGEPTGKWLLLFAKSPAEGHVKTRLHAELGRDGATTLYRAFMSDAIALCRRVSCERRVLSLLESAGSDRRLRPAGFTVRAQSGSGLGERLGEAIGWAFGQGATRVVVVGADSPSLPVGYVEDAFRILRARQAVLGPCWDGGFYLIGFSSPSAGVLGGIDWGTDRVLSQTVHRLGAGRVSYGLLPCWYDIDRPYDLRFLESEVLGAGSAKPGLLCRATRRFLLGRQTEVW